ncbi:superoxide dismutase family protein [Lentibacillus jeotgali]|uniref:superoxide dismutase family protein n=1 Tax=Lentibacillus jeotgali TaxID=558169 RepID=UPI0002628FF3|nr:superoxide dismutase family protein [Lentibacillus jeotgali]
MRKYILIAGLALAMLLAACADTEDDMEETRGGDSNPGAKTSVPVSEDTEKLEVTMYNKDKEKVGTTTIRPVYKGVKVTLEASDLPPGTHGFHIHENGICEAPDFESAGGHFNPTDAKHGFEHPEGPHAGDMRNIEVKEDGTTFADAAAEMVTLEKGKNNSLLKEGGTALVIHSGADDYKSQPSGDAGERIACGVISD